MLTPPENFQTHPKILDPSQRNPNNSPKNLNLPNMHFSTPPPPRKYLNSKKYVNTYPSPYPSPHPFSLFLPLFLHFSKKYENSGGGVKPPEIRPCVLSINKNVFLKILNSPSNICEARDYIIIYRSEQRPLSYFLSRILYKKKSFF